MIYERPEYSDYQDSDPFLKYSGDSSGFGEDPDSLEHHGITGMKWGVRQGPPYPLAEKAARTIHYNVGKMTEKTKASYQKAKSASASRKAAKAEAKAAKKEAKRSAKNNIADVGPKKFAKTKQRISEMSSEELRARIERLKLEEEYRKYLNGGQPQQQKVANGKSALNTVMNGYSNSTFKKVADTLVVGLVKAGVDMAGEYAKTHVQRANIRKQARDKIIKDALERKLAARREEESARKKREEERYQDERSVRTAAQRTYATTRATQKAKYDAEDERERELERRRRASSYTPGLPS